MDIEEKTPEKQPRWKSYVFPPQVYLILGNELCERFCYYGLRTILSIYLEGNFGISEGISTIIYHIFNTLAYFTPVVGAVLSDSYIGKYKTILYLSIVYAIGNILLAITSIPAIIDVINLAGPVISLILIAIGTGGIKPCVCAFGAEQFSEKDTMRLEKFFAIFYFSINFGSLFSMLLTPIFRSKIECFGGECYLAAFGIPALFFIMAFIFFLAGTRLYKSSKPDNNILLQVASTTWVALKTKFKLRNIKTNHEHWMDYALTDNNHTLIEDIKSLYRVLFLFIPLPIFWTLYDQQGSKWVFQALKMNGNIGTGIVLPDQLQAVNAGLVLLFIPLFDFVIYPVFGKCGLLKNLLHRMITGMVLVAFSFFSAAILDYQIRIQKPVRFVPTGNINIRSLNLFTEPLYFVGINNTLPDFTLQPAQYSHFHPISFAPNSSVLVSYEDTPWHLTISKEYKPYESKAVAGKSYTMIVNYNDRLNIHLIEDISEGIPEVAILRIFVSNVSFSYPKISHIIEADKKIYDYSVGTTHLDIQLKIGKPKISVNGNPLNLDVHIQAAAVYTLSVVLDAKGEIFAQNLIMDIEPPAVHLLWQIAQYIVLTAGEILFSITGLDFAYREAPVSMKSCVIAAWYITTSIGNLIVVIFAEVKVSDDMAIEFTIFGFLLIATSIIFSFMVYQYTKQKFNRKRINSDTQALNDD